MWLWTMLACGGPAELPKPHDPPAWPIENLHVQKRPAKATPRAPGHPVHPALVDPALVDDPAPPAGEVPGGPAPDAVPEHDGASDDTPEGGVP